MLKLKYLFENFDLARQALAHWPHDEDNLDEMLGRFRISSNAIYPFCQDGRVCFLRLAPTEEKLEQNIAGEMEFIDYLAGRGYPALRPLTAVNGRRLVKLCTQWGDYYATAFARVAGVALDDSDFSDQAMVEYGRALGRLHCLAAEYRPKTKKWGHIQALDWVDATLAQYGAPAQVAAAVPALRSALGRLEMREDNYGLVHYDFDLDNVFFDGAAGTCAVIDFDDGMYHWFALDILQALNSLADELDGQRLVQAKAMFIRGYEAERAYTPEMKEALPLMQRFVDLYGYARLIRCVDERFEDEPEWMAGLRKKLDRAIAQTEAAIIGE